MKTLNKTETTCFGFYFITGVTSDNTGELFVTNILTCILNVLFSIITCVGNSTILLAIKNTRDLHSPSYVLLGCLAFSDLLVGLICQPLFVGVKIAEFERSFTVYCWLRMLQSRSGWTTAGVSFFTVAAVSYPPVIALHLHLLYSAFVTVSRVLQATLVIWILSLILNVVLRFWMTAKWFFILLVIFVVVFLVLTVSTVKIFQMVRRYRRKIERQTEAVSHPQSMTVNILKCRKSAVTVLYIYGLFMICYVPFFGTLITDMLHRYTIKIQLAYDFSGTVIFVNSFINPVVYCWRIREIKKAVKNILRGWGGGRNE
ncbi:unnamed protein product [Porites evermanni]|uniref:G-protein coupled receptors family 1 profile domain-containing protein n=1 Tax=Porites evermanni TaxID=104178 RepID=A0ABN8T1L7_9CNID|nr:unnamed protein product [Porites evermanni]